MGDVFLLWKVLPRGRLARNDLFRHGFPLSHIFPRRRIPLQENRSDPDDGIYPSPFSHLPDVDSGTFVARRCTNFPRSSIIACIDGHCAKSCFPLNGRLAW